MGAFEPMRIAAPRSLPGRQRLGHHVNAVHAARALLITDRQLAAVPIHATRGAKTADIALDIDSGGGVVGNLGVILLNLVLPGANNGEVGAGDGSDTVIRTTRGLDLELVWECRTVQLVLVVHRQVVANLHGVVARPLAARHSHATGGRPQVGT